MVHETEMERRVAKALEKLWGVFEIPIGRPTFEAMARTAIRATRDPTDEMLEAVALADLGFNVPAYQAAIDAASPERT